MELKYFLPHHCVINEEKVNSKYRVVFDGSMKSSSNYSLNDIMLKGYQVQPELFDILCRFRLFKYVFVTDIKKMFRQIKLNPDQRYLQNILWRDNPDHDIKCIELSTVTYGLKASPFLATRVLKQHAINNRVRYPLAYQCVLNQVYMDDFICGDNTLESLTQMCEELSALCNSCQFTLHKWRSNSKSFLHNISGQMDNDSDIDNYKIEFENTSNKVLGIIWNSQADEFSISLPTSTQISSVTKRNVVAKVAQMYDPLGLIAPTIITFKIFIQNLWIKRLDWDEKLNEDLLTEWLKLFGQLSHLNDLGIPRQMFDTLEISKIELVGFCDASMKAYGCCIYLRTTYTDNHISSRLCCAKSRVAPLKSLTLPKLELCGALLISKLVNRIIKIYSSLKITNVYLFSDSKITLSWIDSHPSRWTTFVSNRVVTIQELTSNYTWCHIKSSENPADFVSRGLRAKDILNHIIWWEGPSFLQSQINLQMMKFSSTSISTPEERKISLHIKTSDSDLDAISSKFSSFARFQRTIAFCLRFLHNTRSKNKIVGPLKVNELSDSLHLIVKFLQNKYFSNLISSIMSQTYIKDKSILKLNPFLDKSGLIRVGGRLSRADIPYAQKHPLLLPSNNHIVKLMLLAEHLKLFHAGSQTVLSNMRLRFWPLNGLKQIKRIIKNCWSCYRFRASNAEQIMSDLPKERITVARVFSNVGLDYGGPLIIKGSKLRKSSFHKCYFCIFVCMATKSVHIELVSDLTTEAFLATLKRFISRRGCPTTIFSDNATNFLGARNKLRELYEFFRNQENVSSIENFLVGKEIAWKFIAPRSPHWGGLWEAAIKSTKFHLYRVLGNSVLTFEELSTVLTQIEAILNSRPLCPLSKDPADLQCLTPGHFLIGAPVMSYPEIILTDTAVNRLSRWEYCTRLQQEFWRRWSTEYLNILQNRPKWLKPSPNLEVNDLVLLKVENTAPLNWPKARILEVIPEPDNRVRLIKVKTAGGIFTRPISKICPLPIKN